MCFDWPMVMVSSVKGYGLEQLKHEIAQKARSLIRSRNTTGRFRLPVDRVLSPKGIGTLMTEATAKEEFQDRIAYLVSAGKLIPIEGDFYTTPWVAEEIREKLTEYAKSHETA